MARTIWSVTRCCLVNTNVLVYFIQYAMNYTMYQKDCSLQLNENKLIVSLPGSGVTLAGMTLYRACKHEFSQQLLPAYINPTKCAAPVI